MSLDKFGRALHSQNIPGKRQPIKVPVSFTNDGEVDCENRRLCNVKNPHANVDATNKEYVDFEIHNNLEKVKNDFATAFNRYAIDVNASMKSYQNQIQKQLEDGERKTDSVLLEFQNDLAESTHKLNTFSSALNKNINEFRNELGKVEDNVNEIINLKMVLYNDSLSKQMTSLKESMSQANADSSKEIARLNQNIQTGIEKDDSRMSSLNKRITKIENSLASIYEKLKDSKPL